MSAKRDNGDNTFIKITNKVIYNDMQDIKKTVEYIKNNMVSKNECEEHRNCIREDYDSNNSKSYTIILSIISVVVATIAVFLSING